MFNFASVRSAIGNCRFPDDGLLKKAGLAALAKNYDSYPLVYEGRKLCVLLPKRLTPVEAAKLDEAKAGAHQIIVLQEAGAAWTRIWPSAAPATPAAGAPAAAAPAPAATSDVTIELVEEED